VLRGALHSPEQSSLRDSQQKSLVDISAPAAQPNREKEGASMNALKAKAPAGGAAPRRMHASNAEPKVGPLAAARRGGRSPVSPPR
jgi:hypothetical protein